LHAGQVVSLLGDNGAGKTTLVKILSGIHQPDEGLLYVGDEQVEGLTPLRARRFGIETVYQHLALCDNLGAAANVMLGQEPTKIKLGPFRLLDDRAARLKASQLVERVGVNLPDMGVPVRRLSGGQRQAVAIARALVHAHRLIMLDEPTAALGVRQTSQTLDLVRRIAQQGVAVLVISHNLDEVFAVADRLVVMRLGRIVLDKPTDASTREEVVSFLTGMSVSAPV
jgi:ABC-type sugar transport system ATPase subunit